MNRLADLRQFYDLLSQLEHKLGGKRRLADCHGRDCWPRRGVYFFFEKGEDRSDTGNGMRVVRVGTHALKSGSKVMLWRRLSQHRGSAGSTGGNHRGSVFRLLVGDALKGKGRFEEVESWAIAQDASKAGLRFGMTGQDIVRCEHELESAVSEYIQAMPFLWVDIDDEPGPSSVRGVIERNSIALLSNFEKPAIDPPSRTWLGSTCSRERVQQSGLWNNNHVDEGHGVAFLKLLEDQISK
jgi:hypothetical protein